MFLHPKLQAKTKITHTEDSDYTPNAVDVKLYNVFKIHPATFTISEKQKILRPTTVIEPHSDGNYFTLPIGCYEVQMLNTVEVADDEVGWIITRSTLNRNGVFLTSGLYDSGYKGGVIACMHVEGGPMIIERGTRIAQYVSVKAECYQPYNGSYGFNSAIDKERYNL